MYNERTKTIRFDFYPVERIPEMERLKRYDNWIAQDIAAAEKVIEEAKAYRLELAKRAAQLETMQAHTRVTLKREHRVEFGYEPFTGGEEVEYVKGVLSAEEAAEAVYNGLDDADGYNMIFLVSTEYTDAEKFFFKSAELWVANRETGDLIEQVPSVSAGLALIERYEENDKHEGIYEPGFYAVVRAEDREELA